MRNLSIELMRFFSEVLVPIISFRESFILYWFYSSHSEKASSYSGFTRLILRKFKQVVIASISLRESSTL